MARNSSGESSDCQPNRNLCASSGGVCSLPNYSYFENFSERYSISQGLFFYECKVLFWTLQRSENLQIFHVYRCRKTSSLVQFWIRTGILFLKSSREEKLDIPHTIHQSGESVAKYYLYLNLYLYLYLLLLRSTLIFQKCNIYKELFFNFVIIESKFLSFCLESRNTSF